MIYEVEAPDGKIFELEGDSPPTEQELEEIYNTISKPKKMPVTEPLSQGMQAPVSNVPNVELPAPNPLPTPPTWGEAGIQSLMNIPSSGRQALKDLGGAIAHPIETLKNIGKLGLGTLVKAGSVVNPNMDWLPELEETKKYPEAMADFYANRYGGSENIKQTLANDPVGMLSDLASVLSLGGGAVSKVGQAGKIGKVGRAISKVGSAIEPINIVGKGLGLVGKGVGNLTSNILGMTTGAGAESIKQATKAGRTGNQAFKSNLRGLENIENIVGDAKDALNTIKQQRSTQYASQIGKTINDPAFLDVMPIQKKMLDIIDEQYYKGLAKSGKDTMGKVDEMINVYNDFLQDPNLRTAGGLDALKQRIQDINIPFENKKALRLQTSLSNTIKKTIETQSPDYAKTMKDYSQASDLINELEKSLSLGNKSSVDTAVRKLQSLTRNNASSNYGNRLKLAEELEKAGADIMPALAGQSLSSLTPRGLQSLGATGAGVAGITTNPLTLITLPAFSPRVVGETSYLTGRLQELLNKMPVGNTNRGLYQGGRLNRITEEKK